jgi:hypothetical protein
MVPVYDSVDVDEWLSGRQSCRIIGCSPSALQRAALIGRLRFKLEPGLPPKYHREDVERIAESWRRAREA